MITITEYSVEKLIDPFGILSGERYEYQLDISVPEDDELFAEGDLAIRVIIAVEPSNYAIVKYEIIAKSTNTILDFELEKEELAIIKQFCLEHLNEAEE